MLAATTLELVTDALSSLLLLLVGLAGLQKHKIPCLAHDSSRVDPMVAWYESPFRNPFKPIITPILSTTYKTGAYTSDLFKEGKDPNQGPAGNPLE